MDLAGSLYRLPCSLKIAKRAISYALERFLLPRRRLFVRVRSGLSQGLWIHARFPEEASYWRGKRDPFTEKAILATVHEGSVVYDVGAHIGIVSFGTARLVGETGRVVAFDADAENVASLRSSCARNRFDQRMQVVHAAVWSQSTDKGVPFRRGERRRSAGAAGTGFEPPGPHAVAHLRAHRAVDGRGALERAGHGGGRGLPEGPPEARLLRVVHGPQPALLCV